MPVIYRKNQINTKLNQVDYANEDELQALL